MFSRKLNGSTRIRLEIEVFYETMSVMVQYIANKEYCLVEMLQ